MDDGLQVLHVQLLHFPAHVGLIGDRLWPTDAAAISKHPGPKVCAVRRDRVRVVRLHASEDATETAAAQQLAAATPRLLLRLGQRRSGGRV